MMTNDEPAKYQIEYHPEWRLREHVERQAEYWAIRSNGYFPGRIVKVTSTEADCRAWIAEHGILTMIRRFAPLGSENRVEIIEEQHDK